MTLFEYLAIAFSLVFSFAALRLVSGLPYALDPDRRYWIHLCHVFILLVATATVFWTFWSFREVQWNWFLFLSALAGPGIVYYLACALIPENPSEITSWRDHFHAVRRRYFLGVCVWFVVVSVNATLFVGIPLVHPIRGVYLLVLAGGIAGASSDSTRVQVAIILSAVLGIGVLSFMLLLPGSLAP